MTLCFEDTTGPNRTAPAEMKYMPYCKKNDLYCYSIGGLHDQYSPQAYSRIWTISPLSVVLFGEVTEALGDKDLLNK